jgi:regulator of protease activity HflC (stomatin/prohibitin superfamily)
MKFDKNVVSYYEGVLGDDKVLALREMDTTLEQLGIYMEAMPQAERKMVLMKQIEKALQGGRNGLPQITTAVAFRLNGMIERGDVKEAEVYLALEEKRAQREFERNKDRAITLQGEQNAALQQGIAEAERQKINLEGSWKLKNVQAQAIADIAVKIIEQQGQLQNDANFIYLQQMLSNLNNTQNGGTSSSGATV